MKKGAIQIAGVHDAEEARLLVEAGTDWIGFPLGLDKHAEDLTAEEARNVAATLPVTVRGVLITYLNRSEEVMTLAEKIGVTAVQLHGRIDVKTVAELKARRPRWLWWKSVVMGRPGDPSPEDQVREFSAYVDGFLTDTFDPTTGASGATGKVHDWKLSRHLVAISPKPVMVAGGLTAENVGAAIAAVSPWGVDCHTGVEGNDGRKCPRKVAAFIREAKRAWGLH